LRTTNPIESTFATIRLRHRRTKGNGTRKTSLAMMFKLAQAAQKRWKCLRGSQQLPLVLQGKVAAALARCHAAIRRLERTPERAPLKGKILQLRHVLEQELVTTEPLELALNDRRLRLLPSKSALLGRPSSSKAVDIPVGCRWFSRGDKNLRLFSDKGQWFVEDLGSTNGTSIGDRMLSPGKPYPLPAGETVIEVGKRGETAAPVCVRLRCAAAKGGVVVVSLSADEFRLRGSEESQWISWREDLRTQWVLFEERFHLGTAEDSDVVLPDAAAEAAAEIAFDNGFWISPLNAPITVAETPFSERTPIPLAAYISIGDARLRVETPSAAAAAPAEKTPKRAKAR